MLERIRARCGHVKFVSAEDDTLATVPQRFSWAITLAVGSLTGRRVLSDPAWLLVGDRHYRRVTLMTLLARAGLEVQGVWCHGNTWTSNDTSLLYASKHLLRRAYRTAGWLERRQRHGLSTKRTAGSTNIWLKAVVPGSARRRS